MTSIARMPSLPELWSRTQGTAAERTQQLLELFDEVGIPETHAGALHIAGLVKERRFEDIARLLSPGGSSVRAHNASLDGMRAGGFVSRPLAFDDKPSTVERSEPQSLARHGMFRGSGVLSDAQRAWVVQNSQRPSGTHAPACPVTSMYHLEGIALWLSPLVYDAKSGASSDRVGTDALLQCVAASLAHPKTGAFFADIAKRGSLDDVLKARRLTELILAIQFGESEDLPSINAFNPYAWRRMLAATDIGGELDAVARDAAARGRSDIAAAVARVRDSDGEPLSARVGARARTEALGHSATAAAIAATGVVSSAVAVNMVRPRPANVDRLIARGRAFVTPHERESLEAFARLPRADRQVGTRAERIASDAAWSVMQRLCAQCSLSQTEREIAAASIPISISASTAFPRAQEALLGILTLTDGRGLSRLNAIWLRENKSTYADGTGDIEIDSAAPEYETSRLMFHEVGHAAEQEDPGLALGLRAWVERRSAGRPDVSLRDRGYNSDALAKDGDFLEPYVGRLYEGATEVLSMGLEQFCNAGTLAEFFVGDEEHFALTLGWLAR